MDKEQLAFCLIACIIIGLVSFHGGRSFEYTQSIQNRTDFKIEKREFRKEAKYQQHFLNFQFGDLKNAREHQKCRK